MAFRDCRGWCAMSPGPSAKKVRLDIVGETTQVDRDILARLDAPLGHLLRNAVDHGLESPDERRASGKPVEGVLRLEARHSAGALHVIVSDDGPGVDMDKLRRAVVDRNLIDQRGAASLSEAELLEFLFLPGFSMKGAVTEISGRGVGLDVVQDMVRQVHGTVRVSSERGKGTRFQLQLPVTLSVVRALLAEIGGEPYAFPLAHIVRTLMVPKDRIEQLEGRAALRLRRTPDWPHRGASGARDRPRRACGGPVSRHRSGRCGPHLRSGRRAVPGRARARRAAARGTARQDQGHLCRRADAGRLAGIDCGHRRPDALDGQARLRWAPGSGPSGRCGRPGPETKARSSWWTTRSPSGKSNASCSAIAATTSRWPWTGWTAGTRSGPDNSISS